VLKNARSLAHLIQSPGPPKYTFRIHSNTFYIRHLRCDGKEPSCLNCENRRAPCEYLTERGDDNLSNTPFPPSGEIPQASIERPAKKRKIAEPASASATDSGSSTPSSSSRKQSNTTQNQDWTSPMMAPHQQHPQQLSHPSAFLILAIFPSRWHQESLGLQVKSKIQTPAPGRPNR
jgi:hypothetical protein